MEILELFGVDWKLMLAQLINFVIVLLVLWKFAIKPLTKTMESRNAEISKGLEDAQSAADKLSKTESEVKAQLQAAKSEAIAILEQAKKQSEDNRQISLDKTKQEVEEVIKKAKEQIASEKANLVNSAKADISKLLTKALQKVLSEGLSKDIDQKYIDKTLKELK
ncbi:F0F1 ATP synthase subunit B [bacterium]|jgi:F-type H+-transporting ATPase subunit b|nr:F0F1 ATP synthase subunit B [bacterium]